MGRPPKPKFDYDGNLEADVDDSVKNRAPDAAHDLRKYAESIGEIESVKDEFLRKNKINPVHERLATAFEEHSLTDYQVVEAEKILRELCARDIEALRLYEPLPLQAAFHGCLAKERLLRGGNQSSKSTAAALEFSRCVLGQDPFDRYPSRGIARVVGWDLEHIGGTIYPLLFKPGAFLVIRDQVTGKWRPFRRWDSADAARANEAQPAPPLIPHRFIKHTAWERKGEGVVSAVELHTGWEIRFHSSRSMPPQGFRADLVWFDEDIDLEQWPDEVQARIVAKHGWFMWSAMPQCRNTALLRMSNRAIDEAKHFSGNPRVVEFHFKTLNNPHLGEQAKKDLVRALSFSGATVLKQRIEGEFTNRDWLVFPEFTMDVCGRSPFNPGDDNEFIDGQLPLNWSRYAVIDPGYQVCAVLFAAVPPPHFGDFVYLEDELYITQCSAPQLATAMAEKMKGKSYRACIIDKHGSERSETGTGERINLQYMREFEKKGVRFEMNGFIFGCDNKKLRISAVHNWLHIRDDRTTKLRVVQGRLPNFEMEIDGYHRKRDGKTITEEPDDRAGTPVHLCHTLQYLAACTSVRYVKPQQVRRQSNRLRNYVNDKKARQARGKRAQARDYVNLGPGK